MITIKVEGIGELTRNLNDLARAQVPMATAAALTWTAKSAKRRLYAEMRAKLDRPTPFTVPAPGFDDADNVGSMRVEPATKARLSATVKMKDWPAAKQRVATDPLLRHHFFGGGRVAKGMELWFRQLGWLGADEYLVLGNDAPRDRYGNLGMGNWNRMVAQLRITGQGRGYNRDAPLGARSRKGAGLRIFWSSGPGNHGLVDLETGIEYGFRGRPGRQNNLPKGVWARAGGELTCWLAVAKGAPVYRQLFDLRKIGEQAVREEFEQNFRAALKKAIATSGYKGKWR